MCINALRRMLALRAKQFALDILINVKTKIPLISTLFSSCDWIFVLVLVSSTIIQNVIIFVNVFVAEKHWYTNILIAIFKFIWIH